MGTVSEYATRVVTPRAEKVPPARPTGDPGAVKKWLEDATKALDVLTRISDHLKEMPIGEPQEQLDAALTIFERLATHLHDHQFVKHSCQKAVQRIRAQTDAAYLSDVFTRLLNNLIDRGGEAIKAGAVTDKVLVTEDFRAVGALRTHTISRWTALEGKRNLWIELPFVLGLVDKLPTGHFARDLVRPDEFYLVDPEPDGTGGYPALVLGPTISMLDPSSARPYPFYTVTTCQLMTREARYAQKQAAEKRKEEQEQEKMEARKRWWASEEGKVAKALEEIEKLKARNALPPPITPVPAILQGVRIKDGPLSKEQMAEIDRKLAERGLIKQPATPPTPEPEKGDQK